VNPTTSAIQISPPGAFDRDGKMLSELEILADEGEQRGVRFDRKMAVGEFQQGGR
jgi:hypothetical protein